MPVAKKSSKYSPQCIEIPNVCKRVRAPICGHEKGNTSLNPRLDKQTLFFFNHPVFAFMPVAKKSSKYSAQGLWNFKCR